MNRHLSVQDRFASLPRLDGQVIEHEDPYTRISRKDEGNIGGTLSNAQKSSTNEMRATSPGHTDNGSTIMQFGEALR